MKQTHYLYILRSLKLDAIAGVGTHTYSVSKYTYTTYTINLEKFSFAVQDAIFTTKLTTQPISWLNLYVCNDIC